MKSLTEHHRALGANLAPDRIPLDYGDPRKEFDSALHTAVLLDRSHEGRILLNGRDRLTLVNRMSTNDVAALSENRGCATIFTNANARILFRALCINRPEGLLLVSEAGQGQALAAFLRRNIFFGDDVSVSDISSETAQFAILGPRACDALEPLAPDLGEMPMFGSIEIESAAGTLVLARRKPISGSHWLVICPAGNSTQVHKQLLRYGAASGLYLAGSLTYNALRIRSGRPAGLELSGDYIPLEVGLWDEVSFSKGCYTGQEIIARMESRQRLAKIIVKLDLSQMVAAPAPVSAAGKTVGLMTSSAGAANGKIYALAIVRLSHARPGLALCVGENDVAAKVEALAGVQPNFVRESIQ